ncbi:hypothetical protein M5M_01500 [Simiduia agarivorans SA1 = DSM 21679]|uniref:DUF1996 domain-containing protein n=1 Tax=Simiduia agarivorans (strain DSM 21679 / JCM 13881 / BCRC 17597 / SA1) TaxID=1117647 RepID=K4KU78_SIMAS|nr:hypothetical protein M5M_01500 [Simiduia agarivorans SA1 = DSM 21679]
MKIKYQKSVHYSVRLAIQWILPFWLVACGGDESNGENTSESDGLVISVPTLSLLETPAANNTDGFARITFESSAATQCQLNGDAAFDCTSPLFLTDIGAGDQTLVIRTAESEPETAVTVQWTVANIFDAGHEDLVLTNQSPEPVEAYSWRGIVRINCDFSHSSYNDPIVYPGQENAAHLHRFYGNMLVDHMLTTESLLSSGDSSCQGGELNRSAYWVPALLAPLYDPDTGERALDADGEPAWQTVPAVVGNDEEAHEIFYYSAGIDDLSAIQPVPAGLRMIAGKATTQPEAPQDTSIVRWHCQSWESDDAENPQFSATIPECVAPDRVRMDIFFPSCWNGEDLDSADHQSHMAYPISEGGPNGTRCPESHPVAVVRPSYHYAFGVKPEVFDPVTQSSRGWRLASDMYAVTVSTPGGLSLHADWINGWHPQIMAALLDVCIKSGFDCHDGNLGNGLRLSGTQPGSQFEPEIINQGMGY